MKKAAEKWVEEGEREKNNFEISVGKNFCGFQWDDMANIARWK